MTPTSGKRGNATGAPEPTGQPGEPPGRRPALPLIFAVTMTGILANTLPNAPLPDILDHFGQSASAGGFFVGAGALPGVVMAPVIGILADRFGRRRVLVPCLVAFGVFGLAGAVAPSFSVLLAARIAQGVGAAGLINLAVVLIGDFWSGIDRARIIGYNAAVLTVSIAVLPGIGGLLTELGGWRWSFAPYGLALVTAGFAATHLPRDHAGREVGVSLRSQAAAARTVLANPLVMSSVVYGFVVFVLIFGLFLTVLPILLETDLGLSAGPRGFVLTASGLASTTVALNLGRLRRRLGAGRLLVGGATLFCVGFAFVGAATSVLVVLVGVALYGIGEGMSIPTLQDLVAGAGPDASRGAVVAVWVSSVRLGQFLGSMLAAGALAVMSESAIFLVAAGFTAVVALVLSRSPLRSAERVLTRAS